MCRTQFAFTSREPCEPYWLREDGTRPRVTLLDHTPAFVQSLASTISFVADAGFNKPNAPWVRALPYQLSVVMGAVRRSEKTRWHEVFARCRMDDDMFQRVAEQQRKDAPRRLSGDQAAKEAAKE